MDTAARRLLIERLVFGGLLLELLEVFLQFRLLLLEAFRALLELAVVAARRRVVNVDTRRLKPVVFVCPAVLKSNKDYPISFGEDFTSFISTCTSFVN